MRVSHLVWIPSLKRFKRFNEFTTRDQIAISKSGEDPLEFIYHLNHLLKTLMVDTDYDLDDLTLIDKYVIAISMRVHCIGDMLKISITCPNCAEQFNTKVDVNDFISKHVTQLETDWTQTFNDDLYTVTCQIPRIGKEYENLLFLRESEIDQDEREKMMEYYTMTHIKSLSTKDIHVDFDDYHPKDAIRIFREIPISIITQIQTQFLLPLTQGFNGRVADIQCKNTKCDPIELDLSIQTINDLIRILYQESPTEIVKEVYYLSKHAHINSEHVMNTPPIERYVMIETLIGDNKEGGADPSTKQFEKTPDDFFEAEGMSISNPNGDSVNMEQGPSEFKGW